MPTYYINIYVLISDVESQEDARLCNFWEDVCYGKLTIAEVNVTLSHGSIMDLIEIKIQKGKEHLIIYLIIKLDISGISLIHLHQLQNFYCS